MTEVYKCLNGLSRDILKNILIILKNGYNIRPYNLFATNKPKTNRYGQKLLIRNLLSREIKKLANLELKNTIVYNARAEHIYRIYNPGHNILELYNVSVQIRFTTSKTKLDI